MRYKGSRNFILLRGNIRNVSIQETRPGQGILLLSRLGIFREVIKLWKFFSLFPQVGIALSVFWNGRGLYWKRSYACRIV